MARTQPARTPFKPNHRRKHKLYPTHLCGPLWAVPELGGWVVAQWGQARPEPQWIPVPGFPSRDSLFGLRCVFWAAVAPGVAGDLERSYAFWAWHKVQGVQTPIMV